MLDLSKTIVAAWKEVIADVFPPVRERKGLIYCTTSPVVVVVVVLSWSGPHEQLFIDCSGRTVGQPSLWFCSTVLCVGMHAPPSS